jgi:hypothetical protein
MNFYLVILWTLFLIYELIVILDKNKTIKDLIARQNSTHKSLVQVQDNYNQLVAKQKFGNDDTLAKFLYRVIVQKLKMSTSEIDASLNSSENFKKNKLSVVHRLQIKNVLLQLGWIEYGIVPRSEEDKSIKLAIDPEHIW